MALGSACETVASMTTACSFWSPSASPRSGLRAFGVLVPRRGPRCFPKSLESLLGLGGGEQRAQHLGLLGGHPLRLDEAIDEVLPAAVLADHVRDHQRALAHVARLAHRHAGPVAELEVVGREALRFDALRARAVVVAL